MAKQIYGQTLGTPAPRLTSKGYVSEYAQFLQAFQTDTGDITIVVRKPDGTCAEITIPPEEATSFGVTLSTASFPFLPTARKS
jgi:hypothetical protein